VSHINAYGFFMIGFFIGFILASFLISWNARQHEAENVRLRELIRMYVGELGKLRERTKLTQKNEGFGA
jgi:hypothetical protein